MRGATLATDAALDAAEAHLRARELPNALALFQRAKESGTDCDRCSAGSWLAHMLLGDFEAAWRESDAIRARGVPDPQQFWQGEDIRGERVILRCPHGLGDAVQFLRYIPALRERASRLTVEAPLALFDLARMFAGVENVVTWGEHAPVEPPPWDVQIEINELPYFFRTTAADLPIATHYLKLPKQLLRAAAPVPHDASSLRVGLVWASGAWNPARSIPLDLLAPTLDTPGCEFWNLQGGPSRAEWSWLPRRANLHDADFCEQSLPHLAALIAQLDLVITPDTLAAHLAGALGTPAWLLLEHAADWRWQHARRDSLWYPSLHLFRQAADEDWITVMSEVRQALHDQVFSHAHQRLVA